MARVHTTAFNETDCIGDCYEPINNSLANLDTAVQNISAYDNSLRAAITPSSNNLTVANNLTASGNIFVPNRPTFTASISGNVATNTRITGNTTAIASWNAIPVNVGGYFNATTGKFTAPIKGTYWFAVSIANAPTTAAHFGDVTLYRNSTALFGSGGPIVLKGAANIWNNGSFSMPVQLNVNDTVSVGVTNYTGNTGNFYALFSGYLLG